MTRPFDPAFNCPTHFVEGNPNCPACIAKQPKPRDVPIERYRLERTDDRDVEIHAAEIGAGKYEHNGRAQSVRIFRTIAGAYVLHIELTRPDDSPRKMVDRFDSPEALLEGLHHKGKLGRASRDAWHAACATDPALAAIETERFE